MTAPRPARPPAAPFAPPLAAAARWLATGSTAARPESRAAARERAFDDYVRRNRVSSVKPA